MVLPKYGVSIRKSINILLFMTNEKQFNATVGYKVKVVPAALNPFN